MQTPDELALHVWFNPTETGRIYFMWPVIGFPVVPFG